jgi:citrate lyase subunit beta-like protein
MAARIPTVRRALLYVPGSSQKMLTKSRGLIVDTAAYDLEDSVTPDRKIEARQALRQFLQQPRAPGIKEQAVRINAVETGLAEDDLKSVLQTSNVDAIVVPKVNSAEDLHFVENVMQHARSTETDQFQYDKRQKPIKILALIESAKGLSNLPSICTASPNLDGLIFAAEDFALDLSITRTPSLTEFLYARSAIVTAARAHSLSSSIDLVCTSFRGDLGRRTLEEECLGGKALGFNGKQCIHPDQVQITQQSFAPSQEEVQWAVRINIADEKAQKQGRGAWTLDGKMIDAPVVGKAKAIVQKAIACDIDVSSIQNQWEGQEPE